MVTRSASRCWITSRRCLIRARMAQVLYPLPEILLLVLSESRCRPARHPSLVRPPLVHFRGHLLPKSAGSSASGPGPDPAINVAGQRSLYHTHLRRKAQQAGSKAVAHMQLLLLPQFVASYGDHRISQTSTSYTR